ncbi:MAG: hypothetical protein G5663_03110 [Serratia symbiotica]|nr:hypothetical protein [Serratia symbiotica]
MHKCVVLAREAGYFIDPNQARVNLLVPAGCEQGFIDQFFENGDVLNQQIQQHFDAAREMGLVLRHVARFDANGKERASV